MKRSFLILLTLLAISCSIKEIREDCPCLLTIDLSEAMTENPNREISLSLCKDEIILSEDIQVRDGEDKRVKSVPKGDLLLFSVSGITDSMADKDEVRITPGRQSDSVFAYSNMLDTRTDKLTDRPYLRKQFCTIDVQLEGFDEDDYLSVRIKGNYCGFFTSDLGPVEGDFSYKMDEIHTGIFRCRVPRQGDNSLIVGVQCNDKDYMTCNLNEYLTKAGMDWSKPSLDDITVQLSNSDCTVTVIINNWETGMFKETTI